MRVQVYAVLKDYFEKEFEMDEPIQSIMDLNATLIRRNPVAKKVLNISRYAVNDSFVDHDYQLNNNDIICIIPPSSGG